MRGWKAKEAAAAARHAQISDRRQIREIRRAHIESREPVIFDQPEPEVVQIPDDWETLKWPALKSLASKVSDGPIKTREEAVAAIEAAIANDSEE